MKETHAVRITETLKKYKIKLKKGGGRWGRGKGKEKKLKRVKEKIEGIYYFQYECACARYMIVDDKVGSSKGRKGGK